MTATIEERISSTDSETALRETVADFFQVDPEKLTPEFPLNGPRFQGSLAKYTLEAAICRRVGVSKWPAVYDARTFRELRGEKSNDQSNWQSSSNGEEPDSVANDHSQQLPVRYAVAAGVGVDMESVDNLPVADDYWKHDFYQSTFTKAEIAYCLLQENPRVHFAGKWCAKEAIKKHNLSLLKEPMGNIEITHSNNGVPVAHYVGNSGREILPCQLSISHTNDTAVAIAVADNASQPDIASQVDIANIVQQVAESLDQKQAELVSTKPQQLPRIALLLSLIAMLCSLAALGVAILHLG